MSQRTAEFFDSYAHDFDAIYGAPRNLSNTFINRLFRRSMWLRFALTLEGCKPLSGKHVLDIGCGPGHYSLELARRGAAGVLGIDIAPTMVEIARQNAARAHLEPACRFEMADFLTRRFEHQFDYVVAMGFMDYVPDPKLVAAKALSLCSSRCFFSFPVAGGLLAWQRQLRYRNRCDLYMYTRRDLAGLFGELAPAKVNIRRIARDFFVTVSVE